jgi:hypothetical protein
LALERIFAAAGDKTVTKLGKFYDRIRPEQASARSNHRSLFLSFLAGIVSPYRQRPKATETMHAGTPRLKESAAPGGPPLLGAAVAGDAGSRPPTPAMKRFADRIAREKGVKPPPGYATTVSICRAFLNQHAPRKADAGIPVAAGSKPASGADIICRRRKASLFQTSPGPVISALLADWPPEKLKEAKESGSLLEVSEVANVIMFMLTRPRGMTIRDVVMLPTNFDL